jgi:site-specific recombinase XerD
MQESAGSLVTRKGKLAVLEAPAIVAHAGAAGQFAWDEFFSGLVRNPHTRKAYSHAARRFLAWCETHELELARITPGMVGRYFDKLRLSVPTKKVHLAAIRGLFDVLVQRHVIVLNPALSVRTERYSVVEGRTPAISVEQARLLLASINLRLPIDFRDRAILGVLIYTAAREGAVVRLRLGDFVNEGTQYVLRFAEKGGKARSIPVRHDLQEFLREYLTVGNLTASKPDAPVFRTATGSSGRLTNRPMSGSDVCRMVKRRLKAAGLPTIISPHSFRSCAATDLLLQGMPLDDVQYLLGHADARTTKLYDRRQRQVTRNIVERISV